MAESTQILSGDGSRDRHRGAVLALMASEQVLSIEELLRALPWMRWGELFAIVGMCMDEGILVLEKRGFEFDVRLKGTTSSVEHPNGQSTFGLKYKHLDRTRSRYLTRS